MNTLWLGFRSQKTEAVTSSQVHIIYWESGLRRGNQWSRIGQGKERSKDAISDGIWLQVNCTIIISILKEERWPFVTHVCQSLAMGSPSSPRGITDVRQLPLAEGNSLKSIAAEGNTLKKGQLWAIRSQHSEQVGMDGQSFKHIWIRPWRPSTTLHEQLIIQSNPQ